MERLRQRLVGWIKAKVEEVGAAGTVVGLSGGIDSAVAAALCREAVGDRALALVMPINSQALDAEHASLVARRFDLRITVVPLDSAYEAFVASMPSPLGREEARSLALANVKPRLRMLTLYFFANALGYLVVGTSNRAELAVGYFTKYGDGAADILPLGGLAKCHVRALAQHLGVPGPIIDKPPSAGLWPGQTDEGEMGLTYEEIDRYLLTNEATPEVAARIEAKRRQSQHKRERPPIAPVEDLLAEFTLH